MENNVKLTKLSKCGGCGAKVGAGILANLLSDIKTHEDKNLLVGFDKSDDASVYKINEETAVVQTVDFFPPIVDDPYMFGQIAAANALSDIYAMGGDPKLCLNIMCIPEKMSKEHVHEILKGGYDKVYEAGALITGGHSIYDDEPKYGLAVTGFIHPDCVIKNNGSKPGDVLLLTKPIGVGILLNAIKVGLVDNQSMDHLYQQLATLNKSAKDCAIKYEVHAMTDVTGFSVLGHCLEMAQGSEVLIELNPNCFDILSNVISFAKDGFIPAGAYRNRKFVENEVDFNNYPTEIQDILLDPQTSGGLLICVDAKDADALYGELKQCVLSAQRIGVVKEYKNGPHILLK